MTEGAPAAPAARRLPWEAGSPVDLVVAYALRAVRRPLGRVLVACGCVALLGALAVAAAGHRSAPTENLAANASLESDMSYWLNSGTMIQRTTRYARFGSASLAVRTLGHKPVEGPAMGGPEAGAMMSFSPSRVYTASVYVRGKGRVRPLLEFFDAHYGGLGEIPGRATSLSNRWQRLTVTSKSPPGTALGRLFIGTTSPQADVFYVDGAQVEASPAATPFHTGSSTGSMLLFWALIGAGLGLMLLALFGEIGFPVLEAWAVLTVIAYPFLREPRSDPVLTFDRLWIGASVGVLIFATRAARHSRAGRLLLLTLAWLTLSYGLRAATTSGGRHLALVYWLDALVIPLILFVVVSDVARSNERLRRLALALTAAGALLAAIGIAEAIFGFELATRSGGTAIYDAAIGRVRVSGPYPAPEPYALSLLICIAATILWLQLTKRYVLGSAALCLQAVAVGLTFFRVAWLALIVVLFVALKLPRRRLLQLAGALGVVLAAGLLLSLASGGNGVTARLKNEKNIQGRLAAYKQTFEVVRTAPLTGVGVNQYPVAAQRVRPVTVGGVYALQFPHNSYLGTLAEQGIIGVLPLLAVTLAAWYLIRRLGRAARSEPDRLLVRALRAAALAYLLMSLTLTMLPYGPSNAFLAVLLGLGAARLDALAADPEPQTAPETARDRVLEVAHGA